MLDRIAEFFIFGLVPLVVGVLAVPEPSEGWSPASSVGLCLAIIASLFSPVLPARQAADRRAEDGGGLTLRRAKGAEYRNLPRPRLSGIIQAHEAFTSEMAGRQKGRFRKRPLVETARPNARLDLALKGDRK